MESMETRICFTVVPSQGKYVYVGGVRSHQGTPIARLCTPYFPVSFSGEGETPFHYEVVLRAMTKPLHEVEAAPHEDWRLSTRSGAS